MESVQVGTFCTLPFRASTVEEARILRVWTFDSHRRAILGHHPVPGSGILNITRRDKRGELTIGTLGGTPLRTRPFPKWPVVGKEEALALCRVLESDKWGSGMYFGNEGGSEVRRFEKRFAETSNAVTGGGVPGYRRTGNHLRKPAGVRARPDEVCCPYFTFIATATAVLQMGAIPVFVDVLPSTFNIYPVRSSRHHPLRRARRSVCIGAAQPCDIDRAQRDPRVDTVSAFVEDACQAHSAEWKGRRVGGLGTAGALSLRGNEKPYGRGKWLTESRPMRKKYSTCATACTPSGVSEVARTMNSFYAGSRIPSLDGFERGAFERGSSIRLAGLDELRQRTREVPPRSISERCPACQRRRRTRGLLALRGTCSCIGAKASTPPRSLSFAQSLVCALQVEGSCCCTLSLRAPLDSLVLPGEGFPLGARRRQARLLQGCVSSRRPPCRNTDLLASSMYCSVPSRMPPVSAKP